MSDKCPSRLPDCTGYTLWELGRVDPKSLVVSEGLP